MKKSELNSNIHLSEGNIKSKCTNDVVFLTWSLRSRIHCPYATNECKKRCFAKKNETFETVRNSRDKNFQETQKDTFVKDMVDHLEYHLSKPKNKNKRIFVRIHTSGDFYNIDYLSKWVEITQHFKDNDKILFQAYTKSMPVLSEYLFKETYIEENSSLEELKKKLEDTNIHFVWSIWYDTIKDYTDMANKLEMQTFTALPKAEIEEAVTNGAFECKGDCGNCKECYTGKSKTVVIPYH